VDFTPNMTSSAALNAASWYSRSPGKMKSGLLLASVRAGRREAQSEPREQFGQMNSIFRTALLVALTLKTSENVGIKLRDLVRFVFVVALLDCERIVWVVTGTKVFRRLAPRFFPCLQALDDLAEVVFFQSNQVGLVHGCRQF
jgi:hypothetical protein